MMLGSNSSLALPAVTATLSVAPWFPRPEKIVPGGICMARASNCSQKPKEKLPYCSEKLVTVTIDVSEPYGCIMVGGATRQGAEDTHKCAPVSVHTRLSLSCLTLQRALRRQRLKGFPAGRDEIVAPTQLARHHTDACILAGTLAIGDSGKRHAS